MNIKETKKSIIQAGYRAVNELIKVAKEEIVDTEDDVSLFVENLSSFERRNS